MAENIAVLPVTQAADFIRWLHDGEVFETCVIGPKTSSSKLWEGRAFGKKPIVAGWFIDADLAAKISCQIEAVGVYVTLNPVKDVLLSRAQSRLKTPVDRTTDNDISRIKNLLIDIDPQRPVDVSSSDQEHEAALEIAKNIRDELFQEGWPWPLYGDSGNGAHLIYAVDLPNEETSSSLIKNVLLALSTRYASQLKKHNLDIDLKVFNPSRLTKLYGTITRKGDNTQERPHRLSKILELPERETVPNLLLQKLAAELPPEEKPKRSTVSDQGHLDVRSYLETFGREIVKVKQHGTSTLYCLSECVFDPSHSGNESYIGQKADGGLFYGCFHNTCQGRTWAEARQIISGNEPLTRFMVGGGAASFPLPSREGGQVHTIKQSSSLYSDLKTKLEPILKGGGLTPEEVTYILNKISNTGVSKSLTEEVEEYVMTSNDLIVTSNVHNILGLTSRDLKKQANECLRRLADKGKLIPCTDRRGCYRIAKDLEEMDWRSADIENPYRIKWPFELEKYVTIYSGNIIVVAGEKGAGKSAFMYNTIMLNQDKLKIAYFNSESGPQELKLRLSNFQGMGVNLKDWKFKAFPRSENFPEVIFPDHLNIIDYYEFNDDKFYAIGSEIRKIHDRLRKGICIIALQKKKGQEFGRGGDFSREKARLYLTMGGGKLKIIDAKIWASEINPHNLEWDYKLAQGCKFLEME